MHQSPAMDDAGRAQRAAHLETIEDAKERKLARTVERFAQLAPAVSRQILNGPSYYIGV